MRLLRICVFFFGWVGSGKKHLDDNGGLKGSQQHDKEVDEATFRQHEETTKMCVNAISTVWKCLVTRFLSWKYKQILKLESR